MDRTHPADKNCFNDVWTQGVAGNLASAHAPAPLVLGVTL